MPPVDSSPVTASPDPLIGTSLEGRYRIDALIARGGMSAVYLGLDLRLGRAVAIKVMDARYGADSLFLRRFEFEARAVAGLRHPGLVAVYDQSVDAGTAFLVMELVEGGSLRELLRERGPMPPHAVVAVADPVLGALGTAHRAGLVHRDVKPENVLISDAGEVKVADFGLVRAVAEAGVTSASVILGTAAYLSPEQVESTTADARSDVYSMGVMIFEMLTGRTPFRGDTPLSLAYQRLTYDVPAPGDVITGVPPELDEIVLRATERAPANRYPDGFAMQEAILTMADELDLPPFTVPAPRRSAERMIVARNRAVQTQPHAPSGLSAARLAPGVAAVAGRPGDGPAADPRSMPAAFPDAAARGTGEPQPEQATPDDAPAGAAGTRDAEPASPLAQLDEGASALATAMWLIAVVLCALGVGGIGWWVGGGLFH